MFKKGCIFTEELTVTYKKDTSRKMSYLDYVISENLHCLSIMQKLQILRDIISETKSRFAIDEIIKNLPHRGKNIDIT